MSDAISVRNLGKEFRLGQLHRGDNLRETVMELVTLKRRATATRTLWALRDVNLSIREGEVVGLIGRNGAGKSTLLKILSKITYPTRGEVVTRGRVSSLLEVGTGFHDELTGRENIVLNGSILGMTRKETTAKMDAIVEFSGAGVERYLDTPIKRYSSGMRLRLGFAVAAHLDPNILLVDEVLAVGDAGFQRKCLDKLGTMQGGGRTVIFVSHNMEAIENLCERVIWIDDGKVRADGDSREVITQYLATFGNTGDAGKSLADIETRRGNGEVRFTGIELLDRARQPVGLVRSGDPVIIRLHYEARKRVREPHFGIEFYTHLGTLINEVSTWALGEEITMLEPGRGHLDFEIDRLNLMPATYSLSLWIQGSGPIDYDIIEHCASLPVERADCYNSGRGIDPRWGIMFFPCRWHLDHVKMS